MKKKIFIYLIMITTLLLVACAGKTGTDGWITKKNGETVYTYPFTGLETTEEPTGRAVAVMVNNQKEARPQSGLHEADIVFELLAEGNMTRFLALYQSSLPERVGPVRSAREYYFNLANSYDALYVYHGAADFIDSMIRDEGIDFLNGAQYDNDQELFVREAFRVAPHNSYVLFDEVYNRAESKKYKIDLRHDLLPFIEEDDEVTGIDAPHAKIEYFANSLIVEYDYDETKEKYTRTSDGEQTVDLETETPIELDNIFIIEADHEVIDNEGRRAIDLQSGGFGYLLQKGKAQKVQWENDNGYLVAKKDDEVVPFVPGKTWINVIQTNPPANVEQVQIAEYNE